MNHSRKSDSEKASALYADRKAEPLSRRSAFLSRAKIWIFSAICFVLPMQASFIYTLTALLLLVWIAEGQFMQKLESIFHSKLCIAFLAYFLLYVVAMLWTEDKQAGWAMVGRYRPFLLFLLFWTSAKPEYKERYISAFLTGLCVCAVLAYYNLLQMIWLPDWPRGIRVYKSGTDTAPFVDWIMYAPMLALGAYLSLRRAVLIENKQARIVSILVFCFLISNLAFSGGRAGMVMFVALLIALVFERIKMQRQAILFCILALPLAFLLAYKTIGAFAVRVDRGIEDIQTFQTNPDTSVGLRLVYWTTTFRVFMQNPVLGVGSGDLQAEYAKVKPERWAKTPDSYNPHNQFLMTAATTGLLGLAALLSIFYAAASGSDARTKSILIGFAVLCLFESYLWRSNTSLAFSVMLAFLTKKPAEEGAVRKP